MKFIVSKNIIYKTLSHLQSIVNKKNTLPILSNILIEAEQNSLTLSSTDMDISIKETINCNIIESGSTTLNAQIMFDIIKKLPVISGVAFVKKSYFDTGLIVAHEGMIINNKNIIHASSEYGKTVNMDFMEYYFRSDGPLFDGVLFYSFHPIIK